MKFFALLFLTMCFVCAGCGNLPGSDFFQDKDGAFTTKNLTQNRDLTQYDQGGLFWGRTRQFGNENDRLAGEKKVRDFIWQHWIGKKRGYIKFIFAGVDTSTTTHYFVEPNEKGEWIVARKAIYQASDESFKLSEDILNSVERVENSETGDWFLISKSSSGEIIEKLPVY